MNLTSDKLREVYQLVDHLPKPAFHFVTMRKQTYLWFTAKGIFGYDIPKDLITLAGIKVLVRETTPEATVAFWRMDRNRGFLAKDRMPFETPILVKMIKLEEVND